MTWKPPEPDAGAEPEPKPELELDELELELDELEPELELDPEPGLEEPELEEPELEEPELTEVELDPVDAVLCVDPGRTRATAPAVTTLAMVTAVVADRTLSRPRSLAATAWRILSRCALLMYPILRSGLRSRMHKTSRLPQNQRSRSASLVRLAGLHEGQLKPLSRSGRGPGRRR